MDSPLHVIRVGVGPKIIFVHGSAADHTTWSIQFASPLRERFTLVAYDRRVGSGISIENHADDLAELILAERGPTSSDEVVIVGSSFGAAVVLDLIRRHPQGVHGAVLCEPPLAKDDSAPSVPEDFLQRFDELAATTGGESAAEFFLRTVLGDASYERMPRAYRARSQAMWQAIRSDCAALSSYRVRYRQLAAVTTPVLLIGGEKSAPYFRPTLDALAAVLPHARTEILRGAGHMMQAEAHRQFGQVLGDFADSD